MNEVHKFVVVFVGDFFSMETTAWVEDSDVKEGNTLEETAIIIAKATLNYFYGWDLELASTYAEARKEQ